MLRMFADLFKIPDRLKVDSVDKTIEPRIPHPITEKIPDSAEIESVRKTSLAAMKCANEARERDMQVRSEQKPVPMFVSSTDATVIADIEFDYRDALGNPSHRRVNVHSIDDEYFEGFCHKAMNTRTFVIGRVKGRIIDRNTGELLHPKRWAANARGDPYNDGIVVNRRDRLHKEKEPKSDIKPVEILFTGFSKERRAELEEHAEIFEWVVRKNVTKGLKYLCAGPNAGPSKLAQAEESGVQIIDESEFIELLTSL